MRHPRLLLSSLLLLLCLSAEAKSKKKFILPADVLQARTVLVLIDPDAGMSSEAPNANRIALRDVENALQKWGRFQLAIDTSTADLVITVRRGTGKLAEPTIGGLPNNGPVILQPGSDGGRAGGGNVPPIGGPGSSGPPRTSPSPQIEAGAPDDMFVVYRGRREDPRENPLDAPPVWRYTDKDALDSPGVPAVEVFRKLIIEAEKQQSNP